eukprot:SM001380S00430  [mRNA]  locus=s1380:1646:1984:- [translate_table: standard]
MQPRQARVPNPDAVAAFPATTLPVISEAVRLTSGAAAPRSSASPPGPLPPPPPPPPPPPSKRALWWSLPDRRRHGGGAARKTKSTSQCGGPATRCSPPACFQPLLLELTSCR